MTIADVAGLDITVHDSQGMQLFQPEKKLIWVRESAITKFHGEFYAIRINKYVKAIGVVDCRPAFKTTSYHQKQIFFENAKEILLEVQDWKTLNRYVSCVEIASVGRCEVAGVAFGESVMAAFIAEVEDVEGGDESTVFDL